MVKEFCSIVWFKLIRNFVQFYPPSAFTGMRVTLEVITYNCTPKPNSITYSHSITDPIFFCSKNT